MSDPFGPDDDNGGKPSGGDGEGELLNLTPLGGGQLPAGTAMMKTGGQYATAMQVQVKRDLDTVEKNLLKEAALMGEAAFYGWGSGKDAIEGKSVELAMAAARCWGNTAIEYAPIQDAPDSWYLTAYFIDLETGFTMGRPFRMSKRWTVYGKFDEARKQDIRFQIGASKAARNVILKALPAWLTDKALARAKQGVRDKIEKYIKTKGMAAAQDVALTTLLKAGVTEEQVLRKFSIAARTALDVEKLVTIQGDLRAIEAGEERPEQLYPKEGAVAGNGGATTAADILSGNAPSVGAQAQPQATPGALSEAEANRVLGTLDLASAAGAPLAATEPPAQATPQPPPATSQAAVTTLLPAVVDRLTEAARKAKVPSAALAKHLGVALVEGEADYAWLSRLPLAVGQSPTDCELELTRAIEAQRRLLGRR